MLKRPGNAILADLSITGVSVDGARNVGVLKGLDGGGMRDIALRPAWVALRWRGRWL